MKAVCAATLAALLPLAAPAVAPDHPAPIHREGEVLVRYRAGASAADIQAVKGLLGLSGKRAIAGGRTELLALPRFTTTAAALAVLRADPAVELAEPNYRRYPRAVIPNDPQFTNQWGLRNTGQANFVTPFTPGTVGADLNMINAWDADGDGTADRTGDPSVIVAVIDDAIQVSHPDLAPNVVLAHNFITCQDANDPSPVTSSGQHGTLTSGCVAGRGGNGTGIAGVAWNTGLMPLKFGFDSATHLQAIEYARDNGAKVINASFGGPGFSQIESDLIASLAASDMLYVTSAGNDDSNTDVAQLNYPANYPADTIVAVAATNREDDITSFSQYGPLTTDVAAPGLQIVTTAIGSGYSTNPGVSGTSFSSPYTAGIAALLKAHVAPQPGYLEMKARLIESGTSVAGANPKLMTAGGRVDADAALDMAPRPAIVATGVTYDDGANNLLDPGESLTATFGVRNLWQDATNVMATLAVDDPDITVDTAGPVALGTLASLTSGEAAFQITVAGGITEHRYVNFTLTLTADGGYSAVRTIGAELGTLTPGAEVTQQFSGGVYDDFHAWHVDVVDGTNKTLFIRTRQAGGLDIDLLARHAVPPRYAITVGINPELQFGFFCTGGATPDCQDPDTLVSARLDGNEEVSVENPPAGTYHAVVVNFAQLPGPLSHTIEAELLDGDLRPDPFTFQDLINVQSGTHSSDTILITDISAPTPITITGGSYRLSGGSYTTQAGMVQPGDTVQLQATTSGGYARTQVTIGGVTDTWLINLGLSGGGGSGGGEDDCDLGSGLGDGGGSLPLSLLALFGLAALARRLRAA